MLEEEGAVIVGLLVGLNVIDANLCVKGEDLDTQVSGSLCHSLSQILSTSINGWLFFRPADPQKDWALDMTVQSPGINS